MKNRLVGFVKKAVAPLVLVASMAAFSPVTAMAAERGFHGGQNFHAPARVDRGRDFHGSQDRGRDFRVRPDHFVAPRFRPGFSVGVGIYPSYGYVAPVCNPAGFYDQFGVWHFYPGCAVPY